MRLLLAFLLICFLSYSSSAKDYLNEQEVDRVREAQEIDKRTMVFLKIATRRLDAILGVKTVEVPQPAKKKDKKEKKKEKEEEEELSQDYGPDPVGSTSQLLVGYTTAIVEMMDKIDDAYEKRKDDPKLSKALEKVREGGKEQLGRLEQVRAKLKSDEEQRLLEKAIETVKMAVLGASEFDK
jgi:hypothetical protein